MPDVYSNPADLVVVDHVNHFSGESLKVLLAANGFRQITVDRSAYRSAWVVTAQKAETRPSERPTVAQESVNALRKDASKIAEYWMQMEQHVQSREAELSVADERAIYGAGFYGSYVYSRLRQPERGRCFVDANRHLWGTRRFGRPVVAPGEIPEGVTNIRTAAEYSNRLALELRHYQLDVNQKCSAVLEHVRTPLVAFSADDDFQLPAAVGQCATFLRDHPDYEVCSGDSVFAVRQHDRVTVRRYRSVESSNVLRRLSQASTGSYFCLFYGVHRTQAAARRLRIAGETTDADTARILSEAMILQMLVVEGKAKLLPLTSYVREGHARNVSHVAPEVQAPEHFDDQFAEYLGAVAACLIEAGVRRRHAEIAARQSFLDLVPGCRSLVLGRESSVSAARRRLGKFWRRLAANGLRRSGSKYSVTVKDAVRESPEIAVALEMLQEPMSVWAATSSSAA